MNNFIKKLLRKPTGDSVQVEAIRTWIVTWKTQLRGYDTNTHMELFTDIQSANEFGEALEEAQRFVRGLSLHVSVYENKGQQQ